MTQPTDYGRKFRQGEPVSVSSLNYLAELAARVTEVSVTGGAAGYIGAGGFAYTMESIGEFWIKVGANSEEGGRKHHYEWETVQRKVNSYISGSWLVEHESL